MTFPVTLPLSGASSLTWTARFGKIGASPCFVYLVMRLGGFLPQPVPRLGSLPYTEA